MNKFVTKKKTYIIFFNSILVIVLGHFLNISSTGIISFMYTTIHAFLYGTWVGFGSAIVSIVIILGSLVRLGDYSEINSIIAPIVALLLSGLVLGMLSDKMKSYGNILNIKNTELEKMKMSLESTNTELKMQLNNSNMLAKSLVSAKEAAEASNISKSEFLANMSHEIRTPMNGFLGMMQLMQMTQLTEEQEEYIRLSKMSSDALLVVINDILDYSKLEAGKMKLEKTAFNLGTVVNDIVSLFKLLAVKKGLTMEAFIEKDVPNNVIGDPFRLRQIISNLIGNAVKFTNDGHVDIFINKIEVLSKKEVKLKFVIKDTGIGIPDDKTDVLFKSFSQVDNSNTRQYGGTGLGLAICKSLVELMQGKIWVESKIGEGSSFYFTSVLEIAAKNESSPDPLAENHVEYQNEQELSLLLAEDDAVSRISAEKFAMRKGWKITVAQNGKEAVEAFKQRSFDLILMDVQMPVMDGYTATGIIRQIETETDSRTPIIALTAYAQKGDREKCLEAGMDDYLAKPLNIREFYKVVERWTKDKNLP